MARSNGRRRDDKLFHVGLGDYETADRPADVLAPDPVGAVRAYCQELPGDYWRFIRAARVWTKDREGNVRYWDVDAGQPPAWIITRAQD